MEFYVTVKLLVEADSMVDAVDIVYEACQGDSNILGYVGNTIVDEVE